MSDSLDAPSHVFRKGWSSIVQLPSVAVMLATAHVFSYWQIFVFGGT